MNGGPWEPDVSWLEQEFTNKRRKLQQSMCEVRVGATSSELMFSLVQIQVDAKRNMFIYMAYYAQYSFLLCQ